MLIVLSLLHISSMSNCLSNITIIYSHIHIIFFIHILTGKRDMLYENRSSWIPNLGNRIKNILLVSSLLDIRVRPRLLLNLTPWNLKSAYFINPFKNFDKFNTTANIYCSLFACHRSEYNNYIDVHIDGSKLDNLVGCGIICRNSVGSYRLPAIFSVFSAKFVAIEIQSAAKLFEHLR